MKIGKVKKGKSSRRNQKGKLKVSFSLLNCITLLFVITFLIGGFYFINQHQNPLFRDSYFEDFEDQIVGQEPVGWFEWGNSNQVKIKQLEDGNKVCYVFDTTEKTTELVKRFDKTKEGEIKFQIYGLNYQKFTVQIVQTDEEYNFVDDIILDFADKIQINAQIFREHIKVNSYQPEKWYSVRIKYDVEDAWKLWIDEDYKGEFEYHTTPWYFSQLYFYTHNILQGEDYGFYVDNVSISISERY